LRATVIDCYERERERLFCVLREREIFEAKKDQKTKHLILYCATDMKERNCADSGWERRERRNVNIHVHKQKLSVKRKRS
jgi:hypothetical protein